MSFSSISRHCEKQSDEAIQTFLVALDCFASLAMMDKNLLSLAFFVVCFVMAGLVPVIRVFFASVPEVGCPAQGRA